MKKIICVVGAVCISLFAFGGCAFTLFSYASADKYTSGDASLTDVYSLDIVWFTGDVEIKTAETADAPVTVTEESISNLSDEQSVHWYLDGTTLRIKCAASGILRAKIPDKTLIVTVPRGVSYSDVKISTISAKISLDGMITATAEIGTVSGSIDINNFIVEKKLDAESTSGAITIDNSEAYEVKCETQSGACELAFTNVPQKISAESVSGKIKLSIPENAAFTLDFDSISGDLTSDFDMKSTGGKYVCGAGTAEYDIETTSGALTLVAVSANSEDVT